MAHTYLDALQEERAAAERRGQDTAVVDAEIARITGKIRTDEVPDGTDDKPEALGSPSAGDELLEREQVDPNVRHVGGGAAATQRAGRARAKSSAAAEDEKKA